MSKWFEPCMSVNRKKVLFVVALVYTVVFVGVQYRYGWSFISLLTNFGHRNSLIWSATATGDDKILLPDLTLKEWIDGNATMDGDTPRLFHRPLDVHFEDPVLGHTGEVAGHDDDENDDAAAARKNRIAIGSGITSKKLTNVNAGNIRQKFQFFSILLPSFCRTATRGFEYHFYLAYDVSDAVFSVPALLAAFQAAFYDVCRSLCPKDLKVAIHFVQCSHKGKPAWAQNDAMMEAYIDGIEYFYRVNDDSILVSGGWTEAFVETLARYDPTNIGVVGPKHVGGNELILTYDFVHQTHVDIFGFYYPRVFTDWYADDWVTKVYLPGRMMKLKHIKLTHTMTLGQRYKNDFSIYPKLEARLTLDKVTLVRYTTYRSRGYVAPNIKRVISMTVYGNDPKQTMGAIRNAQIIPVFFPEWLLRVYVAQPSPDVGNKQWIAPARIVKKLRALGAQIVYVDTTVVKLEPKWWNFLVADDVTVDYFLVRNTDGRVDDRDAAAVSDWLDRANDNPDSSGFHCIRDHPKHSASAIVPGLWGGRPASLKGRLKPGMHSLLQNFLSNRSAQAVPMDATAALPKRETDETTDFLSRVVWPLVGSTAQCHDSVSCKDWPQTWSFPAERRDLSSYLGQRFDEHQRADVSDCDRLKAVLRDCTGKGKWSPASSWSGLGVVSGNFSLNPGQQNATAASSMVPVAPPAR